MNRFLLALLLVGFLVPSQLLSAGSGTPAGILLYARTKQGILLLLADHRDSDRGWAGFGGSHEENETPAETAARETEEETRGYFSRGNLLKQLKGQEPVYDNGFAAYFLEIDFVPASKIRKKKLTTSNEAFLERGPHAWIPLNEALKYLEKAPPYPIDSKLLPKDRKTSYFWPTWLNNLRAATKAGRLPL